MLKKKKYNLIALLIMVLFSFIFLSNNMSGNDKTSNDKIKKQSNVKPGQDIEEYDDFDDDDFEDDDFDDKKKYDVEFDDKFDQKNKLEVKGEIFFNEDFNKHFVSPRDMLYITAEDRKEEIPSVDVRRIEVQINNDSVHEYDGNKTGLFFLHEEGSNIVRASAVDRSGNQSTTKFMEILVDNTPPRIDVSYEVPDVSKQYVIMEGNVYMPAVINNIVHVPRCHIIKMKAFDFGSGVRPNDGLWYSIDSPHNYKPYDVENGIDLMKETGKLGMHTIRFKAVDNVKNESEAKVVNFYLDDVSPSFIVLPKYGKSFLFKGFIINLDCGPHPVPPPRPILLPDPPDGPPSVPPEPKEVETPPEIEYNVWTEDVSFGWKWWQLFNMNRAPDYVPGQSYTEYDFYATVNEWDSKILGISDELSEDEEVLPPEEYEDLDEEGEVEKRKEPEKLDYEPSVDNEFYIIPYDESGISEISFRLDRKGWALYHPESPPSFYTEGLHLMELRVVDGCGNATYGRIEIKISNIPPTSGISLERDDMKRGGTPDEYGTSTTGPTDDEYNEMAEKE